MKLCRIIFRRTTGTELVRTVYGCSEDAPELADEIKDFSILNGYSEPALEVIDLPETDPEFEKAVTAETIRLENGSLVYTFAPIEPEPQPEPDPVVQLNDKVDLLIQMQLEREGIV
jgi:hypothetical protein